MAFLAEARAGRHGRNDRGESRISRAPTQITDQDVDDMIRVNVKSALYGMQEVLPHVRERAEGQPPVVRTDFGLNALHGGPDSRTLPGSQSAEEVAAVIVRVIDTRAPDVYTRSGAREQIAQYYATVGVDA